MDSAFGTLWRSAQQLINIGDTLRASGDGTFHIAIG